MCPSYKAGKRLGRDLHSGATILTLAQRPSTAPHTPRRESGFWGEVTQWLEAPQIIIHFQSRSLKALMAPQRTDDLVAPAVPTPVPDQRGAHELSRCALGPGPRRRTLRAAAGLRGALAPPGGLGWWRAGEPLPGPPPASLPSLFQTSLLCLPQPSRKLPRLQGGRLQCTLKWLRRL